jgi:hypothetical protein
MDEKGHPKVLIRISYVRYGDPGSQLLEIVSIFYASIICDNCWHLKLVTWSITS